MSNDIEQDEDKTQIQLVPATSINFTRKNDLVKTLKRLDKGLEAAFKLLEEIIEDKDVDKKLKVDCAKFLIEKRIAVSDSVSKDQLSRAIAQSRLLLAEKATQHKIKNAGSGSGDDEDEEYATPKYCPDLILNNENISKM